MVTPPLKVLAPLKVRIPVPIWVTEPGPEMTPELVVLSLRLKASALLTATLTEPRLPLVEPSPTCNAPLLTVRPPPELEMGPARVSGLVELLMTNRLVVMLTGAATTSPLASASCGGLTVFEWRHVRDPRCTHMVHDE